MVDYKVLEQSAEALKNYVAEGGRIPYKLGGMSLKEADCQGLCEYLLMECGKPKASVNLKGSNAHYRKLRWVGTLEEAMALFGKIPDYAWIFMVEEGVKPKGYTDNLGDANHMGQYLTGMKCIHASASRGQVVYSDVSLKNATRGGWNRVGLNVWTRYEDGVEQALAKTLGAEILLSLELEREQEETFPALQGQSERPGSRYVRVATANGGAVRIREKHDPSIYKFFAPNGAVLLCKGMKGKYYRVVYEGKERLLHKDFAVPHEMG